MRILCVPLKPDSILPSQVTDPLEGRELCRQDMFVIVEIRNINSGLRPRELRDLSFPVFVISSGKPALVSVLQSTI